MSLGGICDGEKSLRGCDRKEVSAGIKLAVGLKENGILLRAQGEPLVTLDPLCFYVTFYVQFYSSS